MFKDNQVKKIASANGITLFWIQTQKFKTNSINIFFHDNLTNENASKNALIPAVLRRGCSKHPSIRIFLFI